MRAANVYEMSEVHWCLPARRMAMVTSAASKNPKAPKVGDYVEVPGVSVSIRGYMVPCPSLGTRVIVEYTPNNGSVFVFDDDESGVA